MRVLREFIKEAINLRFKKTGDDFKDHKNKAKSKALNDVLKLAGNLNNEVKLKKLMLIEVPKDLELGKLNKIYSELNIVDDDGKDKKGYIEKMKPGTFEFFLSKKDPNYKIRNKLTNHFSFVLIKTKEDNKNPGSYYILVMGNNVVDAIPDSSRMTGLLTFLKNLGYNHYKDGKLIKGIKLRVNRVNYKEDNLVLNLRKDLKLEDYIIPERINQFSKSFGKEIKTEKETITAYNIKLLQGRKDVSKIDGFIGPIIGKEDFFIRYKGNVFTVKIKYAYPEDGDRHKNDVVKKLKDAGLRKITNNTSDF